MGKTIVISLISILTLHILGIGLDLYHIIWWYDIPMHILGGAWIAFVFVNLFCKKWRVVDYSRNKLMVLVAILGSVALAGVFWEFYEYLSDVYLLKIHPLFYAPNHLILPDTLKDLLNDIIGGLGTSLVFLFKKDKNNIQSGSSSPSA